MLSPKLRKAIEISKVAIGKNPKHDLNLGYRRLMYSLMGPKADLSTRAGNLEGYRRRVNLGVCTIQKVLYIWEEFVRLVSDDLIFPNDDHPHQLLDKAKGIMSGNYSIELGLKAYDDIEIWAEDYPRDCAKYQQALAVGEGAFAVLQIALWEVPFDLLSVEDFDPGLTEGDIDPNVLDPSFFAANAESGGSIWDEKTSPEKRKKFWEWWLDDAVPFAWASCQ
jgi:hypothetical protein